MRRKDCEVTSLEEMEAILRKSIVCRLALNGEGGFPYILPMNYGFVREGDALRLYFHCAKEGTKLDLMEADPRAAFEVDVTHTLVEAEAACDYTFGYESVVGRGLLRPVEGEEKRAGLLALMAQVAPGKTFEIPDSAVAAVTVLRLDVEEITGKRRARG